MIEVLMRQRWLLCLLALLCALALGAVTLQRHNAQQQEIGAQRERSMWEARTLKAEQSARQREMTWMTEVSHAQSQAQENRQVALAAQRSAADAGRLFSASLARERDRTAASTPDASREYAATVSAILDQCQAAYRELAAAADSHAADSLMLQQAWPK
ncbi:hypothetical protein [Limnohabitans sp.]